MYLAQFRAPGIETTIVQATLAMALPAELLWADSAGANACGVALLPLNSVWCVADGLQRLVQFSVAARVRA